MCVIYLCCYVIRDIITWLLYVLMHHLSLSHVIGQFPSYMHMQLAHFLLLIRYLVSTALVERSLVEHFLACFVECLNSEYKISYNISNNKITMINTY
jgi:hypothetical protein